MADIKHTSNVRKSTAKAPPHRVVKVRNDWYRDSFKKIVTILFASVALNLLLSSGLLFGYLNPTQPRYFATNDAGQIIPIVALSEPNSSSSKIMQFASDAARESYSFDYVNYKSQLNRIGSIYFSSDGFDSFVKALTESGNLEAVKSKRLIVKTIVSGVPSITKQGILNGRYSWRVEVPVKIIYKGSEMETIQEHVIAMTIQRMDVLKTSQGIGIIQFLVM